MNRNVNKSDFKECDFYLTVWIEMKCEKKIKEREKDREKEKEREKNDSHYSNIKHPKRA